MIGLNPVLSGQAYGCCSRPSQSATALACRRRAWHRGAPTFAHVGLKRAGGRSGARGKLSEPPPGRHSQLRKQNAMAIPYRSKQNLYLDCRFFAIGWGGDEDADLRDT